MDKDSEPLMEVHAKEKVYGNLFRSYIDELGRVEICVAYKPDDWDDADEEVMEMWSTLLTESIQEAIMDLSLDIWEEEGNTERIEKVAKADMEAMEEAEEDEE